ncbi:MAG: AMP-binding protein [Idiomarina sp.]|nr:AMP-binding protein [Idiomarina sp.]
MTLSAENRRKVTIFSDLSKFEGVAFCTDQESITYRELETLIQSRMLAVTEQLAGVDVRREVLGLCFETSVDAIVDYLACVRVGLPLLLSDPDQPDTLRDSMWRALGVTLTTAGSELARLRPSHTQAARADLAVLMSTSGSSGSPKAVMLSRNNLEANAQAILAYLPISERDTAITSLPLHYSFGLSVLNTHLAAGAKIVLTNLGMMERGFWDLVKAQGVTSLSGVPFHYQMLRMLRLERMELPALRYLTQAGGRLEAAQVKHFSALCAAKGWQLYVMYGQTEATARMAFVPPEAIRDNPDIIGRAIPGGRFIVRDPESREEITEPNVDGELCYLGDNIMLGYAQCAADWQQQGPCLTELATGDLAHWTTDGWLRITGRMSRFLKVRGKRLQLDHLEQLLDECGIQPAYCCGIDDKLFVVVSPEQSTDAKVMQLMTKDLGIHHSLWSLVAVPAIPRLSSGKIDYPRLLTLCLNSEKD